MVKHNLKIILSIGIVVIVLVLSIYIEIWKFVIAYFFVAYILSFIWIMSVKKVAFKKASFESIWLAISWFGLYYDANDQTTRKKNLKTRKRLNDQNDTQFNKK